MHSLEHDILKLATEADELSIKLRLLATKAHAYLPSIDDSAAQAIASQPTSRTTKACALVRLIPGDIISLKQIRVLVRRYDLSGFGTWAVWNLRNAGELRRIGRGVYEWAR
jgi:hypothetical protein